MLPGNITVVHCRRYVEAAGLQQQHKLLSGHTLTGVAMKQLHQENVTRREMNRGMANMIARC